MDGKKERKRKMHRALGMLLAVALVFNTLPVSGFVVSASEQGTGLCEHHTEHTAECICETLCTEDSINRDCPVCGAEGADLSACKGKEQGNVPEIDTGEKTEEQEKTGEKVITAWEWIDPEEYLTDGMLALPGAGRENPAFVEDVTALLPEKIQAKVAAVNAAEDGEETEEDAEAAPETEDAEITLTGWKCASYPEDGAYEGTYTFTAFLPEGFVLAEDAAALEVEVELGGGEMLEGEVSADYQEASWNGSEVTYTGKTENCTSVESSTEAVTWNAGWYVVNSIVTITEPITVTGEVNLILADGCTLTAEKGIVVTTDNSLTIYAQTGGTGTLTATGTVDSDKNASAGIGGSAASVDSGTITIHGGVINATGGVVNDNFGAPNYGGAGIGGGTPNSGNGGSSGAIKIYGGTITANSGEGNLTGAGIGGGASGNNGNGGAGSNITIYGGSVTAASTGKDTGGAGIGGGGGDKGGGTGENINIYGGTVNATGGSLGAGIGGGGGGMDKQSGNGAVTISGGTVKAVGGNYAAGIGGGGGYYSSITVGGTTISSECTGGTGSVTITGGIVDASSPTNVYYADYKGDPIGNGGNAGDTAATVNKTNAIVFENGAGTVCGDVTLDGSYTVPGDYTLNIPAGASLSGSGTLSGGSAFTTENLTEDMISVPEDWHYTGEDRTADIETKLSGELDKGVTICGQTFTVGGWTLAVEKTGDLTYTATYTNNNDSAKTFTKTITLLKSGTKFEGDIKTYNGDTQTTTFSADDTITVKATPTATGAAPQKAAARLQADLDPGQMALYVGDTLVSSQAADADADGTYTMNVSAADVLTLGGMEPNGDPITLTAKFVGNDNMADAAGTVKVNISAVAQVTADGTTIYVGALGDAFTDENSGTTVTLLVDVNLGDQCITLSAGNITLTGSGRTLTGSGSQTIEVTGGELIVENVTVKNTNSESHTNSGIHVPSGKTAKVTVGESATVTGSTGIRQLSGSLTVSGTVEGTNSSGFGVRAQGATLIVEEGAKISGGNEGIRHTVGGNLTINGGTINGNIAGVQITEDVTAKLNGGTFTGVYNAVAINGSDTTTMGNLLNTGYAIFKDDGTAVERTKTSTGPGTFTVKKCDHAGAELTSNGDGTHTLNCQYCGYTGQEDCDSAGGDVLYTGTDEKAPTCTEDGLGHRECTKCGYVMETGVATPALGHIGGTATCSRGAVCTRCGQDYGDTDSNNHANTEVRGIVAATCTAGGYSGDIYCRDCGVKMKTGVATPALGHDYTGKVTKEATTDSEGTKTYTCTRCRHSYTESIPKLSSSHTGNSQMEEVAKNSVKLDSGISVKWKGNALALKWTKIAEAEGYDIFAAQSGKKLKQKSPVKTVKNGKTSVSITKISGKKISEKKAYSVKIKAWKYVDGQKVYIGSSRTYHVAGKENKKYTNAKKLKPEKKKYVLKKGKSVYIQVRIVKQSDTKKLLPKSYGPALQYWSGNEKIATVSSKGRVKAKKKGTCYIYVTALNGVRTRIKITVK